MQLRGLYIFLFVISKITLCYSQYGDPKAYARLDTNVMLIGDKNTYHVSIGMGEKDQVINISPENPLDTGVFEITNASKWDNKVRVNKLEKEIAFIVWDSGLYRIPSIIFTIQRSNGTTTTVESPSLLLTVNNPRGIENMIAPIGIKDIIREEWAWEDVMPWVLGAVILGALGVGIWFFYKKMKEKPKEAVVQRIIQPPHITAIQLLNELKTKALWQKGELKTYYSELSHILRGYLEERFNIPALETTTDELITEFQTSKSLKIKELENSDIIVEKLQDLLQTSDLVKFAKVEPPTALHDKFWLDAMEIVERTKPKPINEIEKINN
jgi:hypothetical protein